VCQTFRPRSRGRTQSIHRPWWDDRAGQVTGVKDQHRKRKFCPGCARANCLRELNRPADPPFGGRLTRNRLRALGGVFAPPAGQNALRSAGGIQYRRARFDGGWDRANRPDGSATPEQTPSPWATSQSKPVKTQDAVRTPEPTVPQPNGNKKRCVPAMNEIEGQEESASNYPERVHRSTRRQPIPFFYRHSIEELRKTNRKSA